MTAEILIKKLMVFYNVFTISELSNIIGVSQPSISGWKKHNYVKAIANKCKELGIYNEIFGDLKNTPKPIRQDFSINNHSNHIQNIIGSELNINMSSSIGERFDFALKELKITNKEIAESFNISSQNVSNLKKNDRLNDLISQIATKYNINLNWLVTGKGNYIIEEQSIQDDKNKTNNNDLSKYFIALQSVADATNKEDELIEDIKNLMKKYIGE